MSVCIEVQRLVQLWIAGWVDHANWVGGYDMGLGMAVTRWMENGQEEMEGGWKVGA